MGAVIDLTGQRFGSIEVLSRAGSVRYKTNTSATWNVVCDCGTEWVTIGKDLRKGRTTSCSRGSCHWKYIDGESIEYADYQRAHQNVRRTKGRADDHRCIDCGEEAKEWSYIGGAPDEDCVRENYCRFSMDANFYVPRCHFCHRKIDRALRIGGNDK